MQTWATFAVVFKKPNFKPITTLTNPLPSANSKQLATCFVRKKLHKVTLTE